MKTSISAETENIGRLRTAVERAVKQHFQISSGMEDVAGVIAGLSPLELFESTPVNQLKSEIVAAGKKLWQREYVDGNGGNISARITDNLVLCTPTLCSKGELRADQLSIVDLDNRRIFGLRPHTSEILLHLEIYKTVPEARAVIHCHPPHATAHAVAQVIPQGNLIPEQEVFVGPVALAKYETPGTPEFARTVVPFVKQHNTVLLANHGIVCWADTVSHAEWYVEVIETYCKTLMIAKQLRPDLPEIPADKIADLLAIKKRLGLPDARIQLIDNSIPSPREGEDCAAIVPDQMHQLIDAITLSVLREMGE